MLVHSEMCLAILGAAIIDVADLDGHCFCVTSEEEAQQGSARVNGLNPIATDM